MNSALPKLRLILRFPSFPCAVVLAETGRRGEVPMAAPLVMSDGGGIPEAPGRPLSLAFTSRSVNLSWAPPFNADKGEEISLSNVIDGQRFIKRLEILTNVQNDSYG